MKQIGRRGAGNTLGLRGAGNTVGRGKYGMVAALASVAMILAGCGGAGSGGAEAAVDNAVEADSGSGGEARGGDVRASESTGSAADRPAPTSGNDRAIDVDVDSLQQVTPSYFRSAGRSAFKYTVDGTVGECFGYAEFVTCVGTADDTVPDIDFMGRERRPGAIRIGGAGVSYTGIEGAPPATEELRTGHWVNFGTVRCAKPDASRLVCASDGGAFEIAGEDRRIRTDGRVYPDGELPEATAGQPATEYSTGTDVLVRAPMMCGAMEGHRLANVVRGEITCAEAMDVLDHYDSIAREEGGGNTLFATFDGWGCSYPTAARSAELRASTVCEHPERGIRVEAPTS